MVILEGQILQVQPVLQVLQEHLILQDQQSKAQMVLQDQVLQALQVQQVLVELVGVVIYSTPLVIILGEVGFWIPKFQIIVDY